MTTLSSGQKLLPGQSLQSNNKLHTFMMQQDGNVVLYDRNSKPLWSTNTGGTISPRDFIMQTDGNLVLYGTDGKAHWASNTYNNPAHFSISRMTGISSLTEQVLKLTRPKMHCGRLAAMPR